MKKGIHPKWNKNVEITHNGKTIMTVGSTSENLDVEIWSGNHPFYTGKETLVDTDNLVDKFNEKLKKASKKVTNKRSKREKRRRKTKETYNKKQVTLKDMLKDIS